MSEPRALLVVDDDDVYRRRLAQAFRDRGLEVLEAATVDEAEQLASARRPAWAVVDLRLPTGSGLDLLPRLRQARPDLSAVMLTGYGSIATAVEATKRGAVQYLQKPANADEILRAFADDRLPLDEEPQAPSLDRVEWEHLQRVLADADGNVSEAARRLGIHRRSLQRKLQRHPPPK